jgi:branched-chain amino acid transport system permease protein
MGYINNLLILGSAMVIASLGVSILTGYTGLFSIGHAGFMALGGYMSAILAKEYGAPMWLALLGGGAFAGLCSLIIGYPSFRSQLRGDYFAIATLGFSEAVRLVLNNAKQIGPIKTGGAFGYMGIPSLANYPPVVTLLAVLALVALALFLAHMFVTSQYGKNCIAIRQDEVAAQMMGVNLLKTKLMSLFISAFYAGVAGGLMGFYYAYQNPNFFGIQRSSDLLAAVVFGGIQSLLGPFITAFILVAVPQILLPLAEFRLVIYGFLFVIVMIYRPQGLLGYVEMNFNFLRVFWNKLRHKPAAEGDEVK